MNTRRQDIELRSQQPGETRKFESQVMAWADKGVDEDGKDYAARMQMALSSMGVSTGETRAKKLSGMIASRVRGKSLEEIQDLYPGLRIDGVIEPRQKEDETEAVSPTTNVSAEPREELPVPEPVDEATANRLIEEFFDYKQGIGAREREQNIKELKQRLGLHPDDRHDPEYVKQVARTEFANQYGDNLKEFMESRLVPKEKEPKGKIPEAGVESIGANRLTYIRNKLNSADKHKLTDAQYLSLYTELKRFYEPRAQTDPQARLKLENVERVYGVRGNRIIKDFAAKFDFEQDIPEGPKEELPKPDDIRGLQLLVHNGGTDAEKVYAAKILKAFYENQAELPGNASKRESFLAQAKMFDQTATKLSGRLFAQAEKIKETGQISARSKSEAKADMERDFKARERGNVTNPEAARASAWSLAEKNKAEVAPLDENTVKNEQAGEELVGQQNRQEMAKEMLEQIQKWRLRKLKHYPQTAVEATGPQPQMNSDETLRLISSIVGNEATLVRNKKTPNKVKQTPELHLWELPLPQRKESLTDAIVAFTKNVNVLVSHGNIEDAQKDFKILAMLSEPNFLRKTLAGLSETELEEMVRVLGENRDAAAELLKQKPENRPVVAPSPETQKSREQRERKEAELLAVVERSVDNRLEQDMTEIGMLEDEKTEKRATPFYQRKRQEIIDEIFAEKKVKIK